MASRAKAAAGKRDKKKDKVDSAKDSKTKGTEPFLVCISGKVPLALILLVVMLGWNVGFLHAPYAP